MRLKSGKEDRPGLVDAHVMLFVNAHPQIEIAGEAEVEHEEAIDGHNSINENLEFAPELIVANIDLVNFGCSYVKDVVHGNVLIC